MSDNPQWSPVTRLLGAASLGVTALAVCATLGVVAPAAASASSSADRASLGSQLVRDELRAAWFTLVDGQLAPLVAGDSGVDAATDLSAYQRTITGTEPPPTDAADRDGLLGAGLVAGAAVLVVLVVLLLPMLRRRAGDKDPDEGLSVATAAITLPTKAERAQRAETEKPTTPPEEPTNP